MNDLPKNLHMYDDIINLPHHVSTTRSHMPISDRAAQFAPFAALNGYDKAVKETARLTDKKLLLDEDEKALLNEKLCYLRDNMAGNPEVLITYFIADIKKDGGKYITQKSTIGKIDLYENKITLEAGTVIHIDDILDISGAVFSATEWV